MSTSTRGLRLDAGGAVLYSLLVACGSESSPGGSDAGAAGPPLGAETLGGACTAGCGAADDRKCSSATSACPLCLVDFDHVRLNYCTQDCTRAPCPLGWTCTPIQAFGQPEVARACVADTAACGDGVVQLGEVCDGEDPARGRCEGCLGWVAVCGDGVLQEGEVCDGVDPSLGACVDCQRWEPMCGDGILQPGEACDGDGPAGYCLDCQAVEPPRLRLNLRTFTARGVRRNVGNQTFYYVFSSTGEVTLTLPAEGVDGCDRVEVVEATPDHTRVAWTVCDSEGWGRATWTFGLPRRVEMHRRADGLVPEPYRPSVEIRAREGGFALSHGVMQAVDVSVATFRADGPTALGNLVFWMRQPDPMASFTQAEARLEASFEILHPYLGP